jgi:hypothetical protein
MDLRAFFPKSRATHALVPVAAQRAAKRSTPGLRSFFQARKRLRRDDDVSQPPLAYTGAAPTSGSSATHNAERAAQVQAACVGTVEGGLPDYLLTLRRRVMRRLADSMNSDEPCAVAAPRSDPGTRPLSFPSEAQPANQRPAWVCNTIENTEEERHLRGQMLQVLLKLEKKGVTLTAAGNRNGRGAAAGGPVYCRTT